jgi:hypothetical protein
MDDVRGKPVDVDDGGGGIWVQINFYWEEIERKLSSGRIHAMRKGILGGNDEENAWDEGDSERGHWPNMSSDKIEIANNLF